MGKEKLKKLISVARGITKADTVIKNCNVVDVLDGKIIFADIAIADEYIVGVGKYEGNMEIDGEGLYASAGFIDSHIHIESSYLSPEELAKMIVPLGTTKIIADPHEIVNVCGLNGLEYMLSASKNTVLDVKLMMPSCVPATPFETSGANILASDMKAPIENKKAFGLGEFMNFVGVNNLDDEVLDKLLLALSENIVVDGHAPFLSGKDLNGYLVSGIKTDHECDSVTEMHEKISAGMYVMLREGSACHDLRRLSKGVNSYNASRCLLCSDDRQPKTILKYGHVNSLIKALVEEGIDPILAVRMATKNPAECYNLRGEGAICPGYFANIVLFDNLKDFNIKKTFINGKLVASNGEYLPKIEKADISNVVNKMNVKDFSKEKLALKIKGDKALAIGILEGGVTTKKEVVSVKTKNGYFVYDENIDAVKVAVVERHKGTGNVAVGLLSHYGIKQGAIALSIAHDSHNIIVVVTNDDDMETAVNALISQGGGIVLVLGGKILETMPMPIAGLMSDKDGKYVDEKLTKLHNTAINTLGVNNTVEPVMTLCFMSLAVIPEIKITDKGLFDVDAFEFTSVDNV
ncbi:MAG: adenine deaminase [Eubacteriales bacterium]|nr:adenine deaminase [Eubacteriales bacterium]